MSTNKNTSKNKAVKFSNILIALLILGGLAAVSIHFISKPSEDFLQGQAEATEVHVASKIVGRLDQQLVKEGDQVKKGQLIAVLSSPELDAKLQQAQSAKDAASAQYQKANNGTRSEQVQAAYNLWQQAKAAADLANSTYKRMDNLYRDKVIPAQKRDEALANKNATYQQQQAAYNNYQMAVNGARAEDKMAAEALVNQANGAVSEVNTYRKEVNVTASADGEIEQIFPNVGELVNAGYPVATIVDLNDIWVVFNIKEDLMEQFKMNAKFNAEIPALGNKKVQLQVKYISPLGDFATWTATKTKGDFDLKTFKIKAYPIQKIEGFRPGMSVLIPSSELKK